MKNFDDKFEVLKTILIFTIVICLVTGLMVLIWLYGCQPGAVQGAESTKYFNAKMIEVSKKKIRSRRPVKRRSNPKQETVLITSVPTFNPTVYHQYWVPSVMIEQKWELEKKEDDVNKKNACSPADSGDSIGSGSQTIAKERMLLQKLPLAPVKF